MKRSEWLAVVCELSNNCPDSCESELRRSCSPTKWLYCDRSGKAKARGVQVSALPNSMEEAMRKGKTLVVTLAAGVMLTCGFITLNSRPVFAQKLDGNLSLRTSVAEGSYQALRQIPVMVSVLRDGQVV